MIRDIVEVYPREMWPAVLRIELTYFFTAAKIFHTNSKYEFVPKNVSEVIEELNEDYVPAPGTWYILRKISRGKRTQRCLVYPPLFRQRLLWEDTHHTPPCFLRLERYAWSTVESLWQATNEYAPPVFGRRLTAPYRKKTAKLLMSHGFFEIPMHESGIVQYL